MSPADEPNILVLAIAVEAAYRGRPSRSCPARRVARSCACGRGDRDQSHDGALQRSCASAVPSARVPRGVPARRCGGDASVPGVNPVAAAARLSRRSIERGPRCRSSVRLQWVVRGRATGHYALRRERPPPRTTPPASCRGVTRRVPSYGTTGTQESRSRRAFCGTPVRTERRFGRGCGARAAGSTDSPRFPSSFVAVEPDVDLALDELPLPGLP
jgi:hypothetical protein